LPVGPAKRRSQPDVPDPVVVTVLGPVAPSTLGIVDAHDHLFMNSPALDGELSDPERVTAEVRDAASSGIETIVELTPIGLGRRPDLMREVSQTTGVRVVGATGYHRDVHYPTGHWVHGADEALLASRMVSDITTGMHPHDWLDDAPPDPARAGVMKLGASYQRITSSERRRLAAAGSASAQTGAGIIVHTEIGTFGHEIVDLLTASSASADRVCLAHMDRNPDAELHDELLGRGILLVYDTVGRIKYRPDSQLLELIEQMVTAGHGERLMLGLDLGTPDNYRSYGGGPGMRTLMDTFVPRLRRRIGDPATDAMLRTNPARLLSFEGAARAA
jgi:predicted metal-dependent phosphotriesterase family hydrolase